MHTVRIDELQVLAEALGQPQQKIPPTVVSIRRGAAIQRRQAAGEGKASARPRAGLRLKMIDHEQRVLGPETQLVRALRPAQIGIAGILGVPEQKWVRLVGIAQTR